MRLPDILLLQLKHFETSALLCVVTGIPLDIGLNLRYSPVLQISNFPLTKKSCLLYETIFVEQFYTFTKRGTEIKRIIVVFCYSFKVLLFSKNQKRLLFQTPKLFLLYCAYNRYVHCFTIIF